MLRIESFSFAMGQAQDLDDRVAIFDCRGLADPEGLGVGKNGLDSAVQGYVFDEDARRILEKAFEELQLGTSIAFGCYAGKNRSVAMACMLSTLAYFNDITVDEVRHNALEFWA